MLNLRRKRPEGEDARVMLQLEDGAVHVVAVTGLHLIQPLVRIPVHGAEFPHAEFPAIQAGTLLAVEDGTAVRQLDAYGRQHPQGERAHQKQERAHPVQYLFQLPGGGVGNGVDLYTSILVPPSTPK